MIFYVFEMAKMMAKIQKKMAKIMAKIQKKMAKIYMIWQNGC